MELKELLLKRRSIRKFLDKKVEEEKINELLHAGMSGPSACNKLPWLFYVIEDKELLKTIKETSIYSNYDAPLAIVLCGNKDKFLPDDFETFWVQDVSSATENILLRAVDLGLGAVWCGVYPNLRAIANLTKFLDLPSNQVPFNIIYIGYTDVNPRPRDQYDEKCVIRK